MTTYHLITEQELQQAIDALTIAFDDDDSEQAVARAMLRAVQEREGPRLVGCRQVISAAGNVFKGEPLYTLPEEPK